MAPNPDTNINESMVVSSKPAIPQSGLCLSGGGYRAMVFHIGSLWRLLQSGHLARLNRVASVSGGSITAAVLGMNWDRIFSIPGEEEKVFKEYLVAPLRKLAGTTIDTGAVLKSVILFGPAGKHVAKAYRKVLFGEKTLQDLTEQGPLFIITATNVQSGALFRFSRPFARDWRVGEIKNPRFRLCDVVAASSAFPPVLSPFKMEVDPSLWEANSGANLQKEPFTRHLVLTDGGVYDNLGLEPLKTCSTIFTSDAGGQMAEEAKPRSSWPLHAFRVLNLIDNQVRSLRKRHLIGRYVDKSLEGAFWGIRTNIVDYGLDSPMPCPISRTTELAETPTRLKKMPEKRQEQLINWGYAVTDAALRAHVDPTIPIGSFPYPDAGI